jgi:hypothetical protein
MGTKARPPQFHTVIAQDWEESEAGWGVRPDGFTLHLTREDRDTYVKAANDRQKAYYDKQLGPGITPHEYSRTSGYPQEVTVNHGIFLKLKKYADRQGLWGEGRTCPRDLARPECDVRTPAN